MAEPLKHFFDAALVRSLAADLARVWSAFPVETFVGEATAGLDALELLPRASHIARALRGALPGDYREAVGVIVASLGSSLGEGDGWGMSPFRYLPYVFFVRDHGLADFDASMAAQRELTRRFTAEFSLRVFVAADPARAIGWLSRWVEDPDPHVRRLVSEGTRPRLPWAPRLTLADHRPVLALLDRLVDDPSPYVRRSVANHLGDVWKDDPGLALDVCERWVREDAGRTDLVRHALRHAVKRADPRALALLGGGAPARVEVSATFEPPVARIGESVRIVVTVGSEPQAGDQALTVDVAVGFVKASGKVGWKVFKLARVELPAGERRVLRRSVSLRQHTTRTHVVGTHAVEVQVNGARVPVGAFEVVAGR